LDQGLESDDLVVAREISAEGRSRAWINGRAATAGMLKDVGDLLVEVIGQHENQQLLRSATHLELLDAFGGASLLAQRAEVAERVVRLRALREEQRTLVAGERERLRQVDLLRHQIEEIEAARLQPGEEETLTARRTRLANAERLSAAAGAAYAALYEADGQAAVDRLGQARGALREVAALDPALAAMVDGIEVLAGELGEIAHGLAGYLQGIEARPDELEAADQRLEAIRSLKRKYGDTVAAILASRAAAAAELAALETSSARVADLAPAVAALEQDLVSRCTRLSDARRQAAATLEDSVVRELHMLDMKRARLTVEFGRTPDPDGLQIGAERVAVTPSGVDHVEFLLAANPGEAPRPLAKIASGGELSRLMLALRHVLAVTGGVPVMVCDEVDAGIGARTAGPLGVLLTTAARRRQVLCVTHLAQIASLADQHFWVTKEVERGRTYARVRKLTSLKDRVEEIARMLSGRLTTPIAHEYAGELLAQASRKKMPSSPGRDS
jgi:DNA repair protein RecN (Recombination protein N)